MSRAWPRRTTVAFVVIVLAVAVGAVGSWYAVRTIPTARLSTLTTPAVSSPPGQSAVSVGLAPVAALHPQAPLIQPVIAAYFQAINSRDYAEYVTTQSAGHALTAEEFQTGFRSTQDSGMLITSIAVAPDGRQAADVTFTSRQQPQDGPDGESCTNWHLTMFFDDHAGTYTIGAPPADYHASYQACA